MSTSFSAPGLSAEDSGMFIDEYEKLDHPAKRNGISSQLMTVIASNRVHVEWLCSPEGLRSRGAEGKQRVDQETHAAMLHSGWEWWGNGFFRDGRMATHEYAEMRGHVMYRIRQEGFAFRQRIDVETHQAMQGLGYDWIEREWQFYRGGQPAGLVYVQVRRQVIAAVAGLAAEYFEHCTPYRTMPRHAGTRNLLVGVDLEPHIKLPAHLREAPIHVAGSHGEAAARVVLAHAA